METHKNKLKGVAIAIHSPAIVKCECVSALFIIRFWAIEWVRICASTHCALVACSIFAELLTHNWFVRVRRALRYFDIVPKVRNNKNTQINECHRNTHIAIATQKPIMEKRACRNLNFLEDESVADRRMQIDNRNGNSSDGTFYLQCILSIAPLFFFIVLSVVSSCQPQRANLSLNRIDVFLTAGSRAVLAPRANKISVFHIHTLTLVRSLIGREVKNRIK